MRPTGTRQMIGPDQSSKSARVREERGSWRREEKQTEKSRVLERVGERLSEQAMEGE